uniref:Uncharacterized protein n=1 Tax=Magnetococcus massalia (strain MO-1) TaxID=451514 RepID=A0A1S7LIL2_MAGMO|nr:protein of unknown function [Candidatus Magnetococcus massalia]
MGLGGSTWFLFVLDRTLRFASNGSKEDNTLYFEINIIYK